MSSCMISPLNTSMKILDITNITSAVNRYKGYAKPSLFAVNITPPPSLVNDDIAKDLVFFTGNAELPGIDFNVEQYRSKGYGTTEPRLTEANFAPINMSFFADGKGMVQGFFQKWAQKQYNFDPTLSKSTAAGTPSETFAYPADVWATIEITHYTAAADPIHTYTLHKASISSIQPISLGWELNDQLMFLPVTFVYKAWGTKVTAANQVKYDTAHDAMLAARQQAVKTSYKVEPIPIFPRWSSIGQDGLI